VTNMKVMFVSHVSNKYGAGRSLLNLIDGLQSKGVECYVVMPNQGPMTEELENRGVEYSMVRLAYWASYGGRAWKKVAHAGRNLLAAASIIVKAWKWKADILYTNTSVTPVGALAAHVLRKPHIWHIQEFGKEDYQLTFDLGLRFTLRLIEKLSFRVILISEALKGKYARHIPSQKLEVIYNGVSLSNSGCGDSNGSRSLGESQIPTLVIVGLLHPGKGQIDSVLAVTELAKKGINVKLKIIGAGDADYISKLKQVAFTSGVSSAVEFVGHVDNPVSIVNSADMVLMCSRSEAFGLVTVEGMLSKKPVIGSRSGATPELVKEGFNGLLYEPGDYRELAEKIQYLINHAEEAWQMGRKGFEWALLEFTTERCAGKVFNVLREAMEGAKRKRRVSEKLH